MIDVLVLGQPYWGTRIARALAAHGGDLRAVFVPERAYPRLLAPRRHRRPIVVIRAGYRIGSSTFRGRLFDGFWSLLHRSIAGAAWCHYWLGSDVLDTIVEARAGTLRPGPVSSTSGDLHLADAPWLASELEEVGIKAVAAPVPQAYRSPEAVPPLPSEFRALTYLPAHRFSFYGGDTVLALAGRFPDIAFDVVGSDRPRSVSIPANVIWHGWVADMAARYARATAVIRIPRHDGLGATVIEALLNARHVIYTHPLPGVHAVSPATPETVGEVLEELRRADANGRLGPNHAGRAYALEQFDEHRLAEHLTGLVRAHALERALP